MAVVLAKAVEFPKAISNFRKSFEYSKVIFWYPQHQSRALRQLQDGVHHIDLVIEVRDARIPLTSINNRFDAILGTKARMIVYNKTDLANPNMRIPLVNALQKHRAETPIFTKAHQGINITAILQRAIEMSQSNPVRYPFLSIIVVGMPNVGKSTIINQLRRLGVNKARVSEVGKTAGITQAIQTRVKIYEDPPIYLVDTPGIFDSHVASPIDGLKISVAGCTKDKLTEIISVADYLLFRLNNSHLSHIEKYVSVLDLEGPLDDIHQLLSHICKQKHFYILQKSRLHLTAPKYITRGKVMDAVLGDFYNLDEAARYFLELYRTNMFGPMTLDDLSAEGIKDWRLGLSASR